MLYLYNVLTTNIKVITLSTFKNYFKKVVQIDSILLLNYMKYLIWPITVFHI